MAIVTSGVISMGDYAGTNRSIFQEKSGFTRANVQARDLSLRGFSVNGINDYEDEDGDGVDVSGTPNGFAPYRMSEFYGYTQADPFAWSTTLTTVPSAYFTAEGFDTGGAGFHEVSVGTRIDARWYSNAMQITYEDYVFSETSSSNVTSQSSSVNIFFTGGVSTISSIQARWRIIDGNFSVSATDPANTVEALYKTNGHNVTSSNDTTTQTIRSSGQSGLNQDFTGSYVTITPSTYNGNVLQSFAIQANSRGDNDTTRLRLTGSGDSINLDIRVTRTNNTSTTHTIRKPYVSSVNPELDAFSFEPPDFTCIMPDMLVIANGKFKRVGDVQVGDMIRAQKNLYDRSAGDMDVMVKEFRAHTRSGYWDVGGIHITNDHPVWLSDGTNWQWVKVEDMRPDMRSPSSPERRYIEGSVDPIYLETVPGWYYVFSADKSKVFTVSGNYATTTE